MLVYRAQEDRRVLKFFSSFFFVLFCFFFLFINSTEPQPPTKGVVLYKLKKSFLFYNVMQCTSGICRHCRETLEAQYSGSQLKTPEKSVEAISKSFSNLSLVSTTSSRICLELVSFSQSLLISQSKCLATDC